jgi:hypothetical protein
MAARHARERATARARGRGSERERVFANEKKGVGEFSMSVTTFLQYGHISCSFLDVV